MRQSYQLFDQPCKVILKYSHEDDDDKAQKQHHQHQWVNDGQPVNLQGFGKEWVVSEALSSPWMRQIGLKPVYTVGVGYCQTMSADTDSSYSCTCSFLQDNRFDIFHWNIGKDHRIAIILNVEIQMSP